MNEQDANQAQSDQDMDRMAREIGIPPCPAIAIIIWAGDFNQTLSGSNSGGSNVSRELLKKTLEDLGLVAWNEHLAHAIPGLKTIDLICGPSNRPVKALERFDPVIDGRKLSDHAGYVVEI